VDDFQDVVPFFIRFSLLAVVNSLINLQFKRNLSTLIIFKTLASEASAELTLIKSRTSSTDTLATADSDP